MKRSIFVIVIVSTFSFSLFSKDRYLSLLSRNHHLCQTDENCDFEVKINYTALKNRGDDVFELKITKGDSSKILYKNENKLERLVKDFRVKGGKIIINQRISRENAHAYITLRVYDKDKVKVKYSISTRFKKNDLNFTSINPKVSEGLPIGYVRLGNDESIYKTSELKLSLGEAESLGTAKDCNLYSRNGNYRKVGIKGIGQFKSYKIKGGATSCVENLIEAFEITKEWFKLKLNDEFVYIKKNKYKNYFRTVIEQLNLISITS
jgi:hypothetical protein